MQGYTPDRLRHDLLAGIVVAIVALPLAMAFAIASGVTPERGLYTAIVAGAAISIFGGSRVQIGGPTGAMVAILSVIVVQRGVETLLLAGLVAGVMLILMGALRAGMLIRFIPFPVTTGFTAGIAIIIFTGQINNALGLTAVPQHEQFHLNLLETFTRLPGLNPYAAATAALSLAIVLLVPRVTRTVPGSFVGMIVATLVAGSLEWPVVTIGSRFGGIPRTLPWPHVPALSFSALLHVIQPAFTIAVLGAIESLLSCVVADAKTGDRHDPNKELIGQGIANCLCPLFGGIPATGAIARTATNIRAGATSPVAGLVHALTLAAVMLFFAPWAGLIPLASLAPILMVVAFNMAELDQIRYIFKGTKSDITVLVSTLLLTVFADLTVAVEFGLLTAAVLFIKRMSDVHRIEKVLPDTADPKSKVRPVGDRLNDCPQAVILSVEGALFFGAAQKFEREVLAPLGDARTLVLRMAKVPVLDATGEQALRNIWRHCDKQRIALLVTGLQPQPRQILESTGLLSEIGEPNTFGRTGPAIDRAIARMDRHICARCPYSAFRECDDLKKAGELEINQHRQEVG